jgi:glycosyltransferase involved in cell wall biosynthesis
VIAATGGAKGLSPYNAGTIHTMKDTQYGRNHNGAGVRARPKVLFLASEDRFFWGHPLPVARAALRNGYEVVVATVSHSYSQQIHDEGFRQIPLRFKRNSSSPLDELMALRQLRKIYSEEQPDIVHHLSLKSVLYGSIAARVGREIRAINAVTGLGYLAASSSWKARILGPVIWSVCRFFLTSPNQRVLVENFEDGEFVAEKLKVSRERIIVTRGAGVDVNIFQPSPEPTGIPVVLFASRMLWIKGVAEFCEAARLLHARGIKARFVLAGDTDSANPASIPRQKLLDWQASGDVEWWGNRADMPQVYQAVNLVCLPSHGGEGIPKVLMEAAACGRALVTTNVPGCRDVVQDGLNGIVVPRRSPEGLAGAIEQLLADSRMRMQMGKQSRELAVRDFSQEAVVRHVLALYDELLHSGEAQAAVASVLNV